MNTWHSNILLLGELLPGAKRKLKGCPKCSEPEKPQLGLCSITFAAPRTGQLLREPLAASSARAQQGWWRDVSLDRTACAPKKPGAGRGAAQSPDLGLGQAPLLSSRGEAHEGWLQEPRGTRSPLCSRRGTPGELHQPGWDPHWVPSCHCSIHLDGGTSPEGVQGFSRRAAGAGTALRPYLARAGALPLPAAGDALQGGAAAPTQPGAAGAGGSAARRAAQAPAPPRKQHFLAHVFNAIIS